MWKNSPVKFLRFLGHTWACLLKAKESSMGSGDWWTFIQKFLGPFALIVAAWIIPYFPGESLKALKSFLSAYKWILTWIWFLNLLFRILWHSFERYDDLFKKLESEKLKLDDIFGMWERTYPWPLRITIFRDRTRICAISDRHPHHHESDLVYDQHRKLFVVTTVRSNSASGKATTLSGTLELVNKGAAISVNHKTDGTDDLPLEYPEETVIRKLTQPSSILLEEVPPHSPISREYP
jgi:hypothetical protein